MPCGKITNGKHYSIITDHLGTPIEVYNQEGELIWEREQDLYGNSRQGFTKENFRCPFKYQGQYYDPEIELCYNRFRYYHPETGRYISEDPIGFLSGEPNFFAYVGDTNVLTDVFGLSKNSYNRKKEVDRSLYERREQNKGDVTFRTKRAARRETMRRKNIPISLMSSTSLSKDASDTRKLPKDKEDERFLKETLYDTNGKVLGELSLHQDGHIFEDQKKYEESHYHDEAGSHISFENGNIRSTNPMKNEKKI